MKQERFTDLLGLGVFGLFTLCLLLTVLSGAKVYHSILESTEETSEKRIRTQYIATKVQQNPETSVEEFDGGQALALREWVDGQCYVTYIYCHEGWLRELFCREGALLTRADGEKVMEGEILSLSLEEGLLKVETDGETLYLSAGKRRAVP